MSVCSFSFSLLVVGDESGAILFFDRTIRILYWLKDFNLPPIVSISFNLMKSEDTLATDTGMLVIVIKILH